MRSFQGVPDLRDTRQGPIGDVVPGEAQQGPPGGDEGVALPAVVAEPLVVRVPGPPVDLDRDARARVGQVDLPRPERVAEYEAVDETGAPQCSDEPADQGRVGPVRGGDHQLARSCHATGGHRPTVGPMQVGEPHVTLERAIEERRAVVDLGGGLEHRQWSRGRRHAADRHAVPRVDGPPADVDARRRLPPGLRWHGQTDGGRQTREVTEPEGRRRAADQRRRSTP